MSRSAAVRLARSVVDAAGRPVAGDAALVRVELSVRAMAAEADLSPGTVQKYLRWLDELGIRVDAKNRLFSLTALENAESGSPMSLPLFDDASQLVDDRAIDRWAQAFEALCRLVDADPRQLQFAEEAALSWLREVAGHSPARGTHARDSLRDSGSAARSAPTPRDLLILMN